MDLCPVLNRDCKKSGFRFWIVGYQLELLIQCCNYLDCQLQSPLRTEENILLSPVSRLTLEKGADPKNFAKCFFLLFFLHSKIVFKQFFHGNKKIKKIFE